MGASTPSYGGNLFQFETIMRFEQNHLVSISDPNLTSLIPVWFQQARHTGKNY